MSPYEVLGVSPHATPDEVEAAYHRRLRACHPDLHWGDGPEAVAEAEVQTRAITAAMAQLRSEWGQAPRFTAPPPGSSRTDDGEWGDGAEWKARPQHESWSNFGYTPDSEHDWFGNPVTRKKGADHVDCPLCGQRHDDPVAYRYHLASAHQIDDPAVGLTPITPQKAKKEHKQHQKALRTPKLLWLGYIPWPPFWLGVALFVYWLVVVSLLPTFLLRAIGIWTGVFIYLALLRLAFRYRRAR